MNVLHLYAQPFEHADAFIVGDRDSLVKLREAIDDALASGSGFAHAFVNDGEGYSILIANDEDMLPMAMPYTNDERTEPIESIWPTNHPGIIRAYHNSEEELKRRAKAAES